MIKINFELKLLEDMHTGTGSGNTHYNGLISRDRDHQPVIARSHLLGVWRDSAAQNGLDQKAINTLFGLSREKTGQLVTTSFYIKNNVDTLPWSFTARESESRAPKHTSLRTQEYIPAGSIFYGECWVPSQYKDTFKSILKNTPAYGARNRGDGIIQVKNYQEATKNNSKKEFKNTRPLRILLSNLDPLCLPTTGIPGNIIPSEAYIQGQKLKGALVNVLIQEGKLEAADDWLNHAYISNAYPLPDKAPRITDNRAINIDGWADWTVIPTPISCKRTKPTAANTGVPWWVSASNKPTLVNSGLSTQNDDSNLKRLPDNSYIFIDHNNQGYEFTPTMAMRMRNAKPTNSDPEGKLFTQEEISERTRFILDIKFTKDFNQDSLNAIQDHLYGEAPLLLGRGRCPVKIEAFHSIKDTSNTQATLGSADTLTLTLTSDLLLYNDSLEYMGEPKLEHFLNALGLGAMAVILNESLYTHEEIRGFNALSGLPAIPAFAIRRGSTFLFKGADIAKLQQALMDKQSEGLGERTHIGFGQYTLDLQLPEYEEPTQTIKYAENTTERYTKLAKHFSKKIGNLFTTTQLQNLRTASFKSEAHLDHAINRLPDECKAKMEYIRSHLPEYNQQVQLQPLTQVLSLLIKLHRLQEYQLLQNGGGNDE